MLRKALAEEDASLIERERASGIAEDTSLTFQQRLHRVIARDKQSGQQPEVANVREPVIKRVKKAKGEVARHRPPSHLAGYERKNRVGMSSLGVEVETELRDKSSYLNVGVSEGQRIYALGCGTTSIGSIFNQTALF